MKNKFLNIFIFIFLIFSLVGCAGEMGPQGPQGEQGIQGEKGEQGQPGKDGSSVLTGNGEPSNELGVIGDSYIDLDTWNFYVKKETGWVLGGNIKGESANADHDGTEGLEFFPINDNECAVAVGTAKLLKEIVIPSKYKHYTVTTILGGTVSLIGNAESFAFCENLEKITLPNTITKIYDRAFYGCVNLKEINIPSEITHIGNYVFTDCDKLQYYEDEDGLYLGNDKNPYLALAKVKKIEIKNFAIKEKTKFILNDAFYECSSLESIVIPNSVTSIGSSAFSYCSSLTTIVIPDSITKICNEAFYKCSSLEGIEIPNSVTSIGSSAFSYCSSLISIKLPNGVTNIGEKAFANCDELTTIVIPDSVTTTGSSLFYCSYRAAIYCEVYSKLDGWHSNWNYYNNRVYWAGQWEYDANGNPVPLS